MAIPSRFTKVKIAVGVYFVAGCAAALPVVCTQEMEKTV